MSEENLKFTEQEENETKNFGKNKQTWRTIAALGVMQVRSRNSTDMNKSERVTRRHTAPKQTSNHGRKKNENNLPTAASVECSTKQRLRPTGAILCKHALLITRPKELVQLLQSTNDAPPLLSIPSNNVSKTAVPRIPSPIRSSPF